MSDERDNPDYATSPEYLEKWAEHGKVGAGRDTGERWRFSVDRKHREPEKLSMAPGGTGVSGPPPLDSTYRCVANNRFGQRCRRWALRGRDKCFDHAGPDVARASMAEPDSRSTNDPLPKPASWYEEQRLLRLPYVYAKYLSRALTERIADASGLTDRLDLSAELDLFRATAVDAARLYDATLADNVPDEARHAAGQLLREVLDQVGVFVERYARVETARKDVLTVGSLHVVITQIATMAHDVFGEEPQMITKVREFSDRLRELRLAGPTAQDGTDITPDEQVLAMDDTIPNAEEAA